ncbi:MAG: tRNA lysidine(34) synthetase TilS [Lachnospiraceae bacterium]|nr:tRNA lysidine(34) synthetase TilS [Lachnospiraceae bacterium]
MKNNSDKKRLIEETVRTYIQDNNLLADGEKCLLAVSGGADSVCLLHLLKGYAKDRRILLLVFHYNHHLRGDAADRDEAFVRSLCESHDLPFYAAGGDVKAFAQENGMGIEEAARHLRYEALYRVADQVGADKIALAHHKNDQAETVLFHLCRGTGLAGLAGMKAQNGRLIRPLLSLSREEIEEYLGFLGQDYMTDETNADTDYTRNLIRAKVLPLLEEQVNEKAADHICEAAKRCEQAYSYIAGQTKLALDDCVITSGDMEKDMTTEDAAGSLANKKISSISLSIPALQSYPAFLQQEVVRCVLSQVAGSKKDISSVHVQDVLSLLEKQSGRKVSLPYGMEAVRSFDQLLIAENTAENTSDHVPENIASGNTEKEPRILLETADFILTDETASLIPKKGGERWIDADQAGDDIKVRTPEKEDYFYLDDSHKKYIRDYFSDQKIPAWEREKKMLVACGHHVLCIPGDRISYPVRITEDTRRILKVIMV